MVRKKSSRGMVFDECVGLSFIRCELTPGVSSGLSGSVVFVEISALKLTVALKILRDLILVCVLWFPFFQ